PSSTLYFFFLLPPPPPRSTLFPYTTLFRSARALDAKRRSRHRQPPLGQGPRRLCARRRRGRGSARGLRARQGARCAHLRGGPRLDRKSTRLNSSHVAISYAVFCLKKKKKKK